MGSDGTRPAVHNGGTGRYDVAGGWPLDRMSSGGDSVNRCDECGDMIAPGQECWYMATPVCGDCFTGSVCGECSDSLDTWAEWAAAVDDLPNPADRVPCAKCGG